MTDPFPANAHIAAAASEPRAKKPWTSPTLARIASSEAENSANPLGADAVISLGS